MKRSICLKSAQYFHEIFEFASYFVDHMKLAITAVKCPMDPGGHWVAGFVIQIPQMDFHPIKHVV